MRLRSLGVKRSSSLALGLLLLSASANGLAQSPDAPPLGSVPYDPGPPIQPGYELSSRYRRGPVIAGSITFGVSYGLGAIVALGDKDTDFERHWLLLPVFGPFIGMATQNKTCLRGAPEACNHNAGTIAVLAMLGVLQITGAGLFAYGELDRQSVLVRKDTFSLRLAPATLGHAGQGIAAFGEF